MCMMFSCNPQINFCHFFTSLNLVIFSLKHIDAGHLVNPTPPTILHGSFLIFAGVLSSLKLCMAFGCNPQ